MNGECREVVGIVIHVVTAADLRRATMPAAVVRNDAIAVPEKEQHLRVPVVGRQGPAMAEYDGLAFPPVLVKDVNAVFCRNRSHGSLPFALTPFDRPGGSNNLTWPCRIKVDQGPMLIVFWG